MVLSELYLVIITKTSTISLWKRSVKTLSWSSHWRCSARKGVLKNFAKFTENSHLCQSLFSNKVAGLRLSGLLLLHCLEKFLKTDLNSTEFWKTFQKISFYKTPVKLIYLFGETSNIFLMISDIILPFLLLLALWINNPNFGRIAADRSVGG